MSRHSSPDGVGGTKRTPFCECHPPHNSTWRSRRVLGVDEGTQREEAQRRLDEAKAAFVRVKGADDVAARALDAATRALQQVRVRLSLGPG